MIQKIREMKDMALEKMEQSISERGIERADVAEMGKLADIVKDMAEAEKACMEAEYYGSITEAMETQGYTPELYDGMGYGMGYNGTQGGSRGGNRGGGNSGSRSGYRDSRGRYARRSGYSMDYHEDMEGIREAMQNAAPEKREKIKRELRQMIDE